MDKKNKVYCFWAPYEEQAVYIAAESYQSAKMEALLEDICDHMDSPFVDIRGHLCRREDKTPVFTEYSGKLDVWQLFEIDLLWFSCDECDTKDLTIDDEGVSYTCKQCGHKAKIPYV